MSESLRPDSKLIHYPVPWDLLAALGPQLAKGTQTSVDEFTAAIVKRMKPPPLIEGAHIFHLPHALFWPRITISARACGFCTRLLH